jgi:hypothetical protein
MYPDSDVTSLIEDKVIATKALACKLAKAAWYVMAEGTLYDPERMFGPAAQRQ